MLNPGLIVAGQRQNGWNAAIDADPGGTGGQGALQQLIGQAVKIGIHGRLLREGDPGPFPVGALDQAHPDPLLEQGGNIGGAAV